MMFWPFGDLTRWFWMVFDGFFCLTNKSHENLDGSASCRRPTGSFSGSRILDPGSQIPDPDSQTRISDPRISIPGSEIPGFQIPIQAGQTGQAAWGVWNRASLACQRGTEKPARAGGGGDWALGPEGLPFSDKEARHGQARPGEARHGQARPGEARHGQVGKNRGWALHPLRLPPMKLRFNEQ